MCCHDWGLHQKYAKQPTNSTAKLSPKKQVNNQNLQSQLLNLLLGKDNISDTGSDGFYDVQAENHVTSPPDTNQADASNEEIINEKSVEIVIAEDGEEANLSSVPSSLPTTTTKEGVVVTNNPVASNKANSPPSKPSIKSSVPSEVPQTPLMPPPTYDNPAVHTSPHAMSPLMSRSKPQVPTLQSVTTQSKSKANANKKSVGFLGFMNFAPPTKQRKEKFKGEKRLSKTSQASAETELMAVQPTPTEKVTTPVDANNVHSPISQTSGSVPATPAPTPAPEEGHQSIVNLSPFNIIGAIFGLNTESVDEQHYEYAEGTVLENPHAVETEHHAPQHGVEHSATNPPLDGTASPNGQVDATNAATH